tara:strand:- start:1042 stop:2106 length:1065 start_codon:yes stop_codon:yes gene_type:complete
MLNSKVVYVDFTPGGHHTEYLYHLIKETSVFDFIGSRKLWCSAFERSGKVTWDGSLKLYDCGIKEGFDYVVRYLEDFPGTVAFILHWDEYRLHHYKLLVYSRRVADRIGGIVFRSEVVRKRFSRVGLLDSLLLGILLQDNRVGFASLDWRLLDRYERMHWLPDPVGIERKLETSTIEKCQLLLIGKQTKRKNGLWALQALDESGFRGLIYVCGIIPSEFIEDYDRYSKKLNIRIWNKHLSDEEFVSKIMGADVVCVPYLNWFGSSGIVVNSAFLGKKILATEEGLIGDDVKRHKLGLTFQKGNKLDFTKKLSSLLDEFSLNSFNQSSYLSKRTSKYFTSTIYNIICRSRKTVVL